MTSRGLNGHVRAWFQVVLMLVGAFFGWAAASHRAFKECYQSTWFQEILVSMDVLSGVSGRFISTGNENHIAQPQTRSYFASHLIFHLFFHFFFFRRLTIKCRL